MDRGAAVLAAAAIGGVLAAQAPLNSELARTVGGLPATLLALGISFLAVLVLVVLVGGGLGALRGAGGASPAALVGGGLIGALYISSIVWTVRALGAGGLTAATIAGQLAVALVIDHFGWLGVDRSALGIEKAMGVVLLAAGTYLIVRD